MKTVFDRLGGPIAALGGGIWTAFHFWRFVNHFERLQILLSGSMPVSVGLIVSSLFMGLGLRSLYQSGKLTGGTKWGVVVSLTGVIAIAASLFAAAVLHWDFGWLILIFAELTLSIGLIIFGLANWTQKVLVGWNALPLLMATVYVPSWINDIGGLPKSLPPGTGAILSALYGLGWFLFGALIWKGRLHQAGWDLSRKINW